MQTEPESPLTPTVHESPAEANGAEAAIAPAQPRDLSWVLLGEQGLRAGWSILLFAVLAFCFVLVTSLLLNTALKALNPAHTDQFSALITGVGELALVVALAAAGWIVARIEGRKLWDYFLRGQRPATNFAVGAVSGFAALSALVGLMAAGGWLRFGPAALSGPRIALFAALWGFAFLMVACFEEGLFRGFLQFTLARGLNFWVALLLVAAMAVLAAALPKVNGAAGVWAAAALGLGPCLWLWRGRSAGQGFWHAAWAGSTLFGFVHTSNAGESWIGIFAAALIGFVFCASIRLTGSLWWAIGCHAAWDWAETFFYGTADSGLAAKGHLLTALPAGNPLFSGGADGPEASLLVLPVVLALLALVVALYRRRGTALVVAAQG